MTGYGWGSCPGSTFNVTAELRSVNHRYADFYLRVPREFYAFEDRIRRLLQSEIKRGRVEVNISLHGSPAGEEGIALNDQLAAAYYRAFQTLAGRLNLPLEISVADLVQLPEVLKVPGASPGEERLWPFLEKALQEALERLVERRIAEGNNLSRDLESRLLRVRGLTGELAGRTPQALAEQKQRLESKLQELLSAHFDQTRVLMECAILAERMDIHEETVRLESHLNAFAGALNGTGPAGRRLDFIVQEIFREINTIGAKAGDYRLAALVVDIKTELEKMREQIQNLE